MFERKFQFLAAFEQHVSIFTRGVNDRIALYLCLCLCTHWTQFYCARVQCALIENIVDAMAAVAAAAVVMTVAKISTVSFTFSSQSQSQNEGEKNIHFSVVGWMFATKSRYWSAIFKLLNEMEEHAVRSRIFVFQIYIRMYVNMHTYF